jgi:hypothetical protein
MQPALVFLTTAVELNRCAAEGLRTCFEIALRRKNRYGSGVKMP